MRGDAGADAALVARCVGAQPPLADHAAGVHMNVWAHGGGDAMRSVQMVHYATTVGGATAAFNLSLRGVPGRVPPLLLFAVVASAADAQRALRAAAAAARVALNE
eukprot:gene47547-62964_t